MFTCLPTLQKKEGATFTWAHQKEDQMIKFYLKDAFFTVSIAPQSQHLLHFINEGTRYQFWCLPFGLDPPPCFYLPSFKTNCSLPMKTVILKKVLHWGAYSSTWKQESNWWDQRKMYPYFSIVASVADYFTGLGNKGTINNHRSVILAFHTPTEGGAAWVDMWGGHCLFHSQSATTQVCGDLQC